MESQPNRRKKRGGLARRENFSERPRDRVECCGTLKKDALKEVLDHHKFTGVIVGVRRDEEPTRAKERYFRPRDKHMEWNVEDQPPELWDQFKTDYEKGTHIRIHPLLHWTELNIWEYIERESIPVIPLYFANDKGERYRSIGCAPCTFPIKSNARIRARDHRGTSATPRRPNEPGAPRIKRAKTPLKNCGAMVICERRQVSHAENHPVHERLQSQRVFKAGQFAQQSVVAGIGIAAQPSSLSKSYNWSSDSEYSSGTQFEASNRRGLAAVALTTNQAGGNGA